MHPNAPHHTGSDQIIAEARCWDDFWRTLRQQDSGSKRGPGFARLTALYLPNSPEYRTQLRHVWLLNEVPESVAAHLNLPRVDEGIDIVAEARSGEFWAVQCKFRGATDHPLNPGRFGSEGWHRGQRDSCSRRRAMEAGNVGQRW